MLNVPFPICRKQFGNRLLQASALALISSGFAGTADAQEGAEQLGARILHDRLAHAVEPRVTAAPDPAQLMGRCAVDPNTPPGWVMPLVACPSWPSGNYVEVGKLGDPDSWVTNEFKLNYGIGMINSQYAYARGLTGKGVQMGIVDDGVDLRHTEFAGRSTASITTADTLADGTRCEAILLDGCWNMRGDRSAIGMAVYGIYAELRDPPGAIARFKGTLRIISKIGHGTHVAGIMGGNRDDNGSQGVAFGANISTARIFGDSLSGSLAYPAKFFQFAPFMSDSAWTNMYSDMLATGVRVINNSWGLPTGIRDVAGLDATYAVPENKELLDHAFDLIAGQVMKAGVISVFATGNELGAVAGYYPTLPRYKPEAEPYWVAVTNVGRDEVIDASASTCGAAARWCVAAAGTLIWSAQYGSFNQFGLDIDTSDPFGPGLPYEYPGYRLDDFEYLGIDAEGVPHGFRENGRGPITDGGYYSNEQNGFQIYTGTSMAAPLATGAMTLLFERFPYLEGTFVRDILLTTARDIGAPGVDDIYGWGIIDLRKAIEGPGQLIKDSTVNMTSRAGGTKVWEGDAWDAWTNDISGVGRMTKTGPGWLRLTGANTFNGLTLNGGIMELTGNNALGSRIDVTGGTLMLGGRLTGTPLNVDGGAAIVTGTIASGLTTVGAKGALFGTGTLADLTVNGTITPGLARESMGRLNVSGDYVQNPGAVFNVAVRPVGNAGLLAVRGSATLNGGVLNVVALPGLYQLDQAYRVLNAASGLTGRFDGISTSGLDLPFLAFALASDGRGVDLMVDRGASFASVAQTGNQAAVAGSIDALPNSSAVLNALSQLTTDQGRDALTQVSGEAYAAMAGAALDGSRSVRDAVLGRLLFAQDRGERGFALWGDARRATGERHAGDGYARTRHQTGMYLIGADLVLGDSTTIGGFGGWGRTELITSSASHARSSNAYLGVYGKTTVSRVQLSAGAVMSDHDARVNRSVTIPGLAQGMRSRSNYETRQVYLDAGVDMPMAGATLQPFAQFARVEVSNDGIRETGGSLALSGKVDRTALNVATLGVRLATQAGSVASGLPDWLHVRGSAGYRLIGGDRRPTAGLMLPSGPVFTVGSADAGARAFVAESAIAADLASNIRMEVGYSGQLSDRGHDNLANGRLVLSF